MNVNINANTGKKNISAFTLAEVLITLRFALPITHIRFQVMFSAREQQSQGNRM